MASKFFLSFFVIGTLLDTPLLQKKYRLPTWQHSARKTNGIQYNEYYLIQPAVVVLSAVAAPSVAAVPSVVVPSVAVVPSAAVPSVAT